MSLEEDIEFSRPFDVHTFSDHSEISEVVDQIDHEYFKASFEKPKSNRGRPSKQNYKVALKVLLLDLYLAWTVDPYYKLGVTMDANAYKLGSRYNKLHIGQKLPQIIRHAHKHGLIHLVRGSEASGRVTRIWATNRLAEHFSSALWTKLDIPKYNYRELIELRDASEQKNTMDYTETPMTLEYREEVLSYNQLLHRSSIDVPSQNRTHFEQQGQNYSLESRLVKRIFSRGSFEYHGRFSGGFWQSIPKEMRNEIYINDEPTVELDYSGLHVVLLYAEQGVDYWKEIGGDPYAVECDIIDCKKTVRDWAKKLTLIMLNSSSKKTAFTAFRYNCKSGCPGKKLRDRDLDKLYQAICVKHPLISNSFNADMGVTLMRQDSEIARYVIVEFTARSIPVLCVHDSFIVPLSCEALLQDCMQRAIMHFTKLGPVFIKREGPALYKERIQGCTNVYQLYSGNSFDKSIRSKGYLERIHKLEKWLGMPLAHVRRNYNMQTDPILTIAA